MDLILQENKKIHHSIDAKSEADIENSREMKNQIKLYTEFVEENISEVEDSLKNIASSFTNEVIGSDKEFPIGKIYLNYRPA